MPSSPIHSCRRFAAPSCATFEVLIDRLEMVLTLVGELRDAGHDIYKEDGLLDVEVLPGVAVWQFLYVDGHGVDRDMKLALQISIDQAVARTLPTLEEDGPLGEIGPWAEDDAVSIDDFGAWVSLLRRYLIGYHGSVQGFHLECSRAFPDFVFSEQFPKCLGTFKGDLNDFVAEVVLALVSLADDMPVCMEQPSTYDCMRAFTAKSGYETSMEGNADRKVDFTFQFEGKGGSLRILCEPHIKLGRSARAGDTEYYYHRIYFSTAQHPDFEGKTFIGHIGKHL
jgi:hypothetical protein